MCTSVILFRKKNNWPFIIASNRDEDFFRLSKIPGRHWKNQKYILGGLDKRAGGTWCAINNSGVMGCIHNRNFKRKNFRLKKTRGEIILKILKGKSAVESINIFKKINMSFYDGFNLIIADKNNAYWIKFYKSNKNSKINKIPEGISVITDNDLNNKRDLKINYYKKLFESTKAPEPDKNLWKDWESLLSSSKIDSQTNKNQAICFNLNNQFGTVSSTIISISSKNNYIYRYTEKSPKNCKFKKINLI